MRVEACIPAALLLLTLGACEPQQKPGSAASPPTAADAVASYRERDISLAAVEAEIAAANTPACTQAKGEPGRGSLETLLPCYREVAEALAIEGIVLAGLSDSNPAAAELDDDMTGQRDASLLNAYSQQLADQLEVSEAEITRYFDDHREQLGTPRQFTLFNIFRRHQDPASPEETVAFLNQLKSRIEAGETFTAIARRHSDSETRLRDGLVGHLSEDKLPERLRRIAAGLKAGQVSEPLPVSGGAVIIKVENIAPPVIPDLENLRTGIRALLLQQKTDEAVDLRASAQPVPADAVLLEDDELVAALDGDDPEQVVFDLGGQRLSRAEFRRIANMGPAQTAAELPTARRDELRQIYYQLKQRRLLLISLLESDHPADRELREQIEEPLQKMRLARLTDQLLQQDMWQAVDRDPASLERYYRDNVHHYQSPLKFKLHRWQLPFDHDPSAQLAAMETLRAAMTRGEHDLGSAVQKLGGTVENPGWQDFADLTDLPAKARSYLLQAPAGGYSIPYQQNDTLHMIWVEARQSPSALPYQQVTEQVREDYFSRFERRLYQDAVNRRLAAADFTFHTDNVRRLLLPPGVEKEAVLPAGHP